jgi:23S rRNA (uracil1939-C5)-methyltransferase/tRNA (uracil-5-)-methyltransferase
MVPKKFNPHPYPYHHELEVTITNITNEGMGVARDNGWVIFIPHVVLNEKIRCRIFRNHKNYSDADLIEVLTPSPQRIPPPCPSFGQCGGCQYQHMTMEAQLELKRQQVSELLLRLAHIDHPVEPVIPSPQLWNYRSKITPHYPSAHSSVPHEQTPIGFLRQGTRNQVIDIPNCLIAKDELNIAFQNKRQHFYQSPRQNPNGATWLFRAAQNGVLTDPKALAIEKVLGNELEFLAGDFFQNNPYLLDSFVQYSIDAAKSSGAKYLIDAYCGSGLFALCAAPHFEKVIGIEISESAVQQATRNAAKNKLDHCQFLAADASQLFQLTQLPAGSDTAVIIDPPRAGCSESFLNQLFTYSPRSVVYISCKPATQMRDLTHFIQAGYTLQKVQPIDLFPQTKHLECVITLTRSPVLSTP